MLRLAKAFWDIALWRKSPAQLPASVFLLCLVAAAVAAPRGARRPAAAQLQRRDSRGASLLSVGLPLAVRLGGAGRSRADASASCRPAPRCSASPCLRELVLYPLGSLLNFIGTDRPASIPLGVLLFVGLIWYLLACANIWRAALDSGLGLGAAISVGYLLLSMALEQQLLPEVMTHARAHPGNRRDLHGRSGGDRQGGGISRHRLGSQRLSADEHAARARSASSSSEGYGAEQLDVRPDIVVVGNALSRGSPGHRGDARSRHGVHLRPAVAGRAGAAATGTCSRSRARTARPRPRACSPGSWSMRDSSRAS